MFGCTSRKSRRRKLLPQAERALSRALESCGYRKASQWHSCVVSTCLWPQTLLVLSCADISELNLAKGTTITFPEGKDKLLKFEISIRPEEGIYKWVMCSSLTVTPSLETALQSYRHAYAGLEPLFSPLTSQQGIHMMRQRSSARQRWA